jgi:nucleotide-binding universal stress UspA family protein
MYESILVPLDGSKTAEMVLPYVEEIAVKLADEIVLVGVSEQGRHEIHGSYLKTILEQVQLRLNDYTPVKEVKVYSEVLLGEPATQILNSANRRNVSLIAMTSRGSSSQGPWLLGNVAAKVLRATSKPVLLIRAPVGAEAHKQKRLVRRILVPLDGSRVGETAVPWAETLAQTLAAELVLFQIIGITETYIYYQVSPPPDPEKEKASAMAYLESIEKSLSGKGLKTSSAVAFGAPADEITDYAKANAVDLIAMSSHGRSGIGRWVFGSVTDKVLHSGDTPVLVVRASKT